MFLSGKLHGQLTTYFKRTLLVSIMSALIVLLYFSFQSDFISKFSSKQLLNDIADELYKYKQQSPIELFNSTINTTSTNSTKNKSRPKAAIFYLASGDRETELQKSMKNLFLYFNRAYRYPIIIFHDHTFSITRLNQDLQQYIHEDEIALNSYVNFTHRIPPNFTAEEERNTPFRNRFPNYHHMCAFLARHVFHQKAIEQLDYYIRLDTDSFIQSAINYDIFEYMRDNKFKYGYRHQASDPSSVVLGMANFVATYLREKKITTRQSLAKDIPANPSPATESMSVPIYYANFEVVHVPSFREPQVMDFIEAFYNTRGPYTRRWGDSPQRYFIAKIFFAANEVHYFCDFAYIHQALVEAKTC